MIMNEKEKRILENLVAFGGLGPDRPVLNRPEAAGMMRKGWIEAVDPPQVAGRSKGLSYVMITAAGREALASH